MRYCCWHGGCAFLANNARKDKSRQASMNRSCPRAIVVLKKCLSGSVIYRQAYRQASTCGEKCTIRT